MDDCKELIEWLRKAIISPFDLEPVADAIESLLAENERLESKLANLQPKAEALHKVASAIGFEAGEDVTMVPIVVHAITSNFDKLEQAHQELLAERDDWRTYALESGAKKLKTQQELHEVKRKRDELLAALEEALPMVPCGSFDDYHLGLMATDRHVTAKMILRLRKLIASAKGEQ